MKIDHSSAVPLYKQIEEYIRELIQTGKYEEGEFLPKEENLAKQFGVSRNTVRQGITNLVREGLIKRTPGRGTVLAEKHIATHLSEWHSFSEEMLKKGVKLKNYFIRTEFEKAPDEVYRELQVQDQVELLKLERLRGDQETPFVYFVSWFHPRTNLTGEEDFKRPLYTILEEDYSIYPTYSEEELAAVMPEDKIADYLQLEKELPILCRKRKVSDSGSRLIEYNIGYYRSDKFSYSIRFEKK